MAAEISERPIPTGEGLTFEKVWAMFQETDRMLKEKAERIMTENAEQQKKTERSIKRLNRQMGGLHSSFGELAEHLVVPGIRARFNELGFHFGEVLPGGIRIVGDDGKIKSEVDLLLQNNETVIAVEIKAKIAMKDIDHHARRLEIIRDYRHKTNDTRKILGAIAGAIFGLAEKEAAIEAGFYVIVQTGDTMKMEIPDGFIPREW